MEEFIFQKENRVFYASCFLGYLFVLGFSLAAVSNSFETVSIAFDPMFIFMYFVLFILFSYFTVKGVVKASMYSIFTMFLSALLLALMLYSLYQFLAE